jgi:hypothetical protein
MKARETDSDVKKKVIYYIDEALIFLITIFAIVFDKTVIKLLKTGTLDINSLSVTWPQLVAASFITIMLYGIANKSFKYNTKDKPPMMKRIYTAVFIGIGWQSTINTYMTN